MFARQLATVPRSAVPVSSLVRSAVRGYSSSSSSSSSKPSSKPAGPPGLSAAGRTRATTTRSNSFVANEYPVPRGRFYSNLPAVPNTNHLHPAEVAASSFFALHRPLSINSSIPHLHSASTFSSIFDPLSDAPSSLATSKSSAAKRTIGPAPARGHPNFSSVTMFPSGFNVGLGDIQELARSPNHKYLTSIKEALEDAESNATNNTTTKEAAATSVDGDMVFPDFKSYEFIPFHPPPVPKPRTAATVESERKKVAREQLTFFRTTYPSGITLFATKYREMTPVTSPYMQRVRDKQRAHGEAWKRAVMGEIQRSGIMDEGTDKAEEMVAISVKRQRKLKMKKHKYKKLMKKTRNLRRRLEKQ